MSMIPACQHLKLQQYQDSVAIGHLQYCNGPFREMLPPTNLEADNYSTIIQYSTDLAPSDRWSMCVDPPQRVVPLAYLRNESATANGRREMCVI